jgi:flagellar hook-basal body protein
VDITVSRDDTNTTAVAKGLVGAISSAFVLVAAQTAGSNGAPQAIARIVFATATNPGGLEKAGSSGYRSTFNSGNAIMGTPGAGSLGSLQAGALEMSNVDFSQELTNLKR